MAEEDSPLNDTGNARTRPPLVRLRGVSRSFGRLAAVAPLDLDIHDGDFLAILGPSGCGKTTLLRMIGGFVEPSSGTIEIAGHDVTRLGPERRPTNMVFQGYGLFPHMTVRQNIAYGLRIASTAPGEIARRVDEAIALVHLGDYAEREPHRLSGGQQQRVALARALVLRPKVLLLDEPLAALDLKLRQSMQEELRRLHRQIGGTFVFVTHDQGEAMGLANRIAVMNAGRIEQEGSPEDIYARPNSRFVSTFIGEANVLTGHRTGGEVMLADGTRFADPGADGPVTLIVRPEAVRLLGEQDQAEVSLDAEVIDAVYLGAFVRLQMRLREGETLAAHVPARGEARPPTSGSRLRLGWSRSEQRLIAGEATP